LAEREDPLASEQRKNDGFGEPVLTIRLPNSWRQGCAHIISQSILKKSNTGVVLKPVLKRKGLLLFTVTH